MKSSQQKGFHFGNALDDLFSIAAVKEGLLDRDTRQKISDLVTQIAEMGHVREYMNAFNIRRVLLNYITDSVGGFRAKKTGTLDELLTGKALRDLKSKILKFFSNLPRDYELWIALPNFTNFGTGKLQLTKHMWLEELTPSTLPFSSQLFPKFKPSPYEIEDSAIEANDEDVGEHNAVYLKIYAQGFGSESADTTAVATALSTAKQFLQCLRDSRAVNAGGWMAFFGEEEETSAVLYDVSDQTSYPITLPKHISNAFAEFNISINGLGIAAEDDNSEKSRKKFRAPKNREEFEKNFMPKIESAIRIFDLPISDVDKIRILAALEWAFDANNYENHTLAFIIGCIGVEALIGDDKREQVTERLSDRCAYLLGSTSEEREKLRLQFRDIYVTRSTLTHGRKLRLKPHEEGQLGQVRQLLNRLILREISNQENSLKSATPTN